MEKFKNMTKPQRISIIVIASLLLVTITVILISHLTRKEGDTLVVSVDKVVVGEYDLGKDGVYILNGGTNELTVKDGVAYMSYSECPGHDCENWGKVKYVGQSIICQPNKIVISVVANGDNPDSEGGVDLVS